MTPPLPLVERKQRQARQRIIDAARELFLERGFDGVSVGDIAERAEVGRTTFFRHFGDKQEVVFANEQELLDTITAARPGRRHPRPAKRDRGRRTAPPGRPGPLRPGDRRPRGLHPPLPAHRAAPGAARPRRGEDAADRRQARASSSSTADPTRPPPASPRRSPSPATRPPKASATTPAPWPTRPRPPSAEHSRSGPAPPRPSRNRPAQDDRRGRADPGRRVIAASEGLLSPGVTLRLIAEFAARARSLHPALDKLTACEREVVGLVAAGLSRLVGRPVGSAAPLAPARARTSNKPSQTRKPVVSNGPCPSRPRPALPGHGSDVRPGSLHARISVRFGRRYRRLVRAAVYVRVWRGRPRHRAAPRVA